MDIKLSNRLSAVYNFIPAGAKVADVGTDHGYIPVCLALEGRASRITASDVRKGPLDKARLSAEKYGADDKIRFTLADGLTGTGPGEADCILIAGMGGETIAGILEAAPWTKEAGITLILQPQSKSPELCLWLSENGYRVDDAVLAEDAEKYYIVFKAVGGYEEYADKASLYAHPMLFARRDPLLSRYLGRLVSKLERALRGIEKAEAGGGSAKAEDIGALVLRLRELREETEKWQR